jgi:hypothetical protein
MRTLIIKHSIGIQFSFFDWTLLEGIRKIGHGYKMIVSLLGGRIAHLEVAPCPNFLIHKNRFGSKKKGKQWYG